MPPSTVLYLPLTAFLAVFLKWYAWGFSNYCRDAWNWLDFVCVAIGYVGFIPASAMGNFGDLRSLRALRPLRAISSVRIHSNEPTACPADLATETPALMR